MFSKTKSGLLKKATRRSFNKSVEDAISSACCVRVSRGDSYHHLVIFFFFTVKGMEEADEGDRLTDAEVLAQLTYVSHPFT